MATAAADVGRAPIHSAIINPDDAAGAAMIGGHHFENIASIANGLLEPSAGPQSGVPTSDGLGWQLPEYKLTVPFALVLFVGFVVIAGVAPSPSILCSRSSGLQISCILWTMCACTLFMVVGPSLMMMNKHIMQDLGFDYPMALSSLGLVTSAILVRVGMLLGLASEVREESQALVAGHKWFRTALPIGLAKALTLFLGNAVYMHLGIGFIQMMKACTPCLVLIGMTFAGVSIPSNWTVGAVCVIVCGTFFNVTGNMNVSTFGLAICLGSEIFEALNLVLTQVLLQDSKFTVTEGLYVLAPVGGGCLLGLSSLFELPRAIERGAWRIVVDHPQHFLIASLLGFVVNFLAFSVVQATSSLTLKILNVIRCVGVVVVSVIVYGEVLSSQQIFGYSVTLVGFIGYNFAQLLQTVSDPSALPTSSKGRRSSETQPLLKQNP